jgi:hypothetical protein
MASYVHFAVPEAEAKKVRDASKVTRVAQAQILRQLIEQHLDDWLREFYTREFYTRVDHVPVGPCPSCGKGPGGALADIVEDPCPVCRR